MICPDELNPLYLAVNLATFIDDDLQLIIDTESNTIFCIIWQSL